MKTIAAILAGGSGSRIGGETPKQMLLLGGKPVLEHAIAAFDAHPLIDAVVVVCREDLIPQVRSLVSAGGYAKVQSIVPGGATRAASSLQAIRAAQSLEGTLLLIHDAARPLVGGALITRCLEALERFDAVEPAIPVADTIVRIDADGVLAEVPDRAALRAVQTPQGFRTEVLSEAFRRALEDPSFTVTDDASVVRRYLPEVPVKVVEGEERNRKLTYPSDIPLLERLMME